MDLYFGLNADGIAPGGIQLWSSDSSCTQGEMLWSTLVSEKTWTSYCATFTPKQDATHLSIVPFAADGGASGIYVDNLQVTDSCPD
jgi:hypothetical protein